jgi:hypothetical protein
VQELHRTLSLKVSPGSSLEFMPTTACMQSGPSLRQRFAALEQGRQLRNIPPR